MQDQLGKLGLHNDHSKNGHKIGSGNMKTHFMTAPIYKGNSSTNCDCKSRTTYEMLLLAGSCDFATGWLEGQRDFFKEGTIALERAKAAPAHLVPVATDLGGAWQSEWLEQRTRHHSVKPEIDL